ncbi:MAG TPA: hypothetical protein VNN72_30560, partial [Polyangiaceae bacterium]|nr:hypothetical protein [Polyangiaceae bacterium]
MAESDAGRSATGTVSTEEAERLSERFRPSWEDDPPTVPRDVPPPAAPAPTPATTAPAPTPATPAPAPATAAPAPARAPAPGPAAAPAPIRAPAPGPAPTPAPAAAAPARAPTPATTAKLPATAALGGTLPLADPRRPTLLGISPEAMAAAQGPRGTSADDLDWEVPTHAAPEAAVVGTITDKLPAVAPPGPTPDPAVGTGTLRLPAIAAPASAAPETSPSPVPTPNPAPAPAPAQAKVDDAELNIDVEEVAPDSKPSGIGEKYVPKEEGAPPVVLNDDVQAAERSARAALEAQHRARRAPTIARLKVVELPETLVSAEPFVAPKKGNGRFVALAIGVVVLVAGTALVLGGRSKSSGDKVEPAPNAVATVAPDTAAPPPPPLPSAA